MKATIKFFFIIVCLGWVTSCIPSLHPLYTDKDLVYLPGIIGNYADANNPENSWEILPGNTNTYYKVKMTDKGKTGYFDMHLVKFDNNYFMDFFPSDSYPMSEINSFLGMHLVPAHTFTKVEIKKGEIKMMMFNYTWLDDLIKENKIRISHENVNGNVVLTAGTAELQKFVRKYADDKNAFSDPLLLTKTK